ncbi:MULTISPECIES: ABC transporter permease [Devosia]|uniref:Nickel transport system permease protein NikB n=1 Tax=Devosia equisanguinis TaxID=2490941 RepID=A0A3S4DNZ6_9HYPH|nr:MULTISPECIES: ABC transporter permease [Devosia]ODT48002.1 MAG: nickel ABC transporter permease [Pelagibacterium sp. SCN 63-126]ODU82575.1 MAG: nickel ABC transporter permease [Pelagibacterium sp. SCN 63-17]OJX42290.1 MAG: nickel ABC transporter permease [Devosia sp. 63-57]VDS03841.1 Nickel transport system permease protein NikB [Devosia equisanguinis]
MTLAAAILRRLLQAVLTALVASTLVWALLPLAPGDPVMRILEARHITEPNDLQIANLRAEMGLDQPLPLQYLQWLGKVAGGDLSTSYRTGRPVLAEIAERLPATLLLLGTALAASVLLSIMLAIIAAAWRDRWPDRIILFYTQIGAALPTFVFALLVLQYLVVGAGIGKVLPQGTLALVLIPALTIGIDRAAGWTQLLRASLIEAGNANHALVARARGATRWRVLLRHALPNGMLPFLTSIGISIGALIGGAPIIEEIFTWPGVGRYVLQALSARDYPVIQGFVLLSGLSYVAASLLVDIVAMLLDPRLRSPA